MRERRHARSPSATATARRGPRIVASLVHSLIARAAAAGLDRDELVAIVGGAAGSARATVPCEAYLRLWAHVDARVPDPSFGLRLAEDVVRGDGFSVVRVAARSGSTFGAALARIVRYRKLLGEDTETRIRLDGRHVVLSDGLREPGTRWPRHRAECVLASYVGLGRRWTATDWRPLEVRFEHPRPADVSLHERLFGCRIRFGRRRNELVFDASVLSLPIRAPEPQLRDLLELGPASGAPSASHVVDDVRRVVANALPGGAPSIDDVARRLGTSARTLARLLEGDRLCFPDIVAGVRCDLATALLRDGRASEAEIGFLLGYGQTAQFRRAFTRWTGRAPNRWLARA